jgi:hypothetical protein
MTENRLPSFIVVGPPRTGTSWLHKVLDRYAALPGPTKEPRFFDLHFERGLDWYRSHFPTLDEDRVMGEVAPTYFVSAEARHRMAQTIPDVKIVFIFRSPVERVVSLYRMKRAYGMIPWGFEEALDKDPELLESGMYFTQVEAWRKAFPDKQLLFTVYDDLRADPQSFINSVTAFIGLEPIKLDESALGKVYSSERMTLPRNYLATRTATRFANWCKARKLDGFVAHVRNSALIKLFLGGGQPLTDAPAAALHRVAAAFRPEIEGLEALMGRSLDAWKSGPFKEEPTLSALKDEPEPELPAEFQASSLH